jgi:NTE family protein
VNVGLVLSGGGARAAYQVGALRAVAEILRVKKCPFRILTGLSAGAINAMSLAVGAEDFYAAAERLATIWMSLTPDSVYRTDIPKLVELGVRWIKDISTGGVLGPSRATYLLDTDPLRDLLGRELDLARIPEHFRSGVLRGVAVSATNYLTGTTVTFFDGAPSIEPWFRPSRIAMRERIGVEHVMASAAIPVFFPPVRIDGRIYGDGGVRMTTPVAPAIHLGAEKILSVGIRYSRPLPDLVEHHLASQAESVTLSEVAGVLLNAVFLDSLDNDIDRLERINRTLSAIPESERGKLRDPLRRIPTLALSPSTDLGRLAADEYDRFPSMLRYLLRGIGATGDSGWDLLSYLAFQPEYVGKLMALGFEDTMARRLEVEAFFGSPAEDTAPHSAFPSMAHARVRR